MYAFNFVFISNSGKCFGGKIFNLEHTSCVNSVTFP